MSTFERYLTVWVALCIVVGIALGHFFPTVFYLIGSAEIGPDGAGLAMARLADIRGYFGRCAQSLVIEKR